MAGAPAPSLPFESALLVASALPDGQFVSQNDVWTRTLGPEDDPWANLQADDAAMAEQYVAEAARGALVTHQIFLVQSAERDEPLPVLLHFLPVALPGRDGSVTRAVTLTGEVLTEPSTWVPSQTQRSRLANLGHMTMGIAHDFNNLLSGILGHTELLNTAIDAEGSKATLHDHTRTIERAALDGAALIKKIQQYIRQEKQTDFERLDLPTLIEDCVSLMRPYWYNEPRRSGIQIDVEVDVADDLPAIQGSATELREVFVNLLLNAVQAMPKGGTVTFTGRAPDDDTVTVEVADTGTGMTASVQQRLFEPLFTTKGEAGTGMGLAVSNGIIQEHGGTIRVASTLGKGTTFTITFPAADAEVETIAAEAAPHARIQARLLVVDDEDMVRSVLAKLLGLKGHTVIQAASAPEAQVLIDDTIDLVFTDQAMPEMSGRDLARDLRRRYPHLPIVLLTGDTEVGTADENVTLVLGKPFKIDDLDAAIQRLVRRTKEEGRAKDEREGSKDEH